MARKRMIDPNIWTDKKFLQLQLPLNKLIFIGMISLADDEGIIEIDYEVLKSRLGLLECNQCDISAALVRMNELQMVYQYDTDGEHYAILPNFYKHQYLRKPYHTVFHRPDKRFYDQNQEYCMGYYRTFKSNCIPSDTPVTHRCGTGTDSIERVERVEECSVEKRACARITHIYNGKDEEKAVLVDDVEFDVSDFIDWYKKEYNKIHKKHYRGEPSRDFLAAQELFKYFGLSIGNLKHYCGIYLKMEAKKPIEWISGWKLRYFADNVEKITGEIDKKYKDNTGYF